MHIVLVSIVRKGKRLSKMIRSFKFFFGHQLTYSLDGSRLFVGLGSHFGMVCRIYVLGHFLWYPLYHFKYS